MITIAILVLTISFSIYAMNKPEMKYKYIFHPYSINHYNQHYRFLSHAFLHGDFIHLAFNMYALLIFGPIIEEQFYPLLAGVDGEPNIKMGSLYYVILYTGSIYASSIFEYFKNKENKNYSSLGASGAVNALVFSFILVAPSSQLGFFFIPMPAWIFGVVYLGITFYLSKRNTGVNSVDNIGHEAHFWGAVFGILFTGLLKPALFSNFFNQIFN